MARIDRAEAEQVVKNRVARLLGLQRLHQRVRVGKPALLNQMLRLFDHLVSPGEHPGFRCNRRITDHQPSQNKPYPSSPHAIPSLLPIDFAEPERFIASSDGNTRENRLLAMPVRAMHRLGYS